MDGADLNMTQRFLEKRRKLREAAAMAGDESKKKEVDRRASKHRKIRYVVHEKIVNFMAPMDSVGIVMDSKESILATIFG